jgi:hypothetical protein
MAPCRAEKRAARNTPNGEKTRMSVHLELGSNCRMKAARQRLLDRYVQPLL